MIEPKAANAKSQWRAGLCLSANESVLKMSKGGWLYACPSEKGRARGTQHSEAKGGEDVSLPMEI